ncbi:formate hydrogenlyase subunit 4 [Citrobacter koseri]|nr:formate hydrogenlyase subunit 4 [Citrobacter koseri]
MRPADSGWVFRLTPFVMVGVMLTIATALPVVTVGSPLPQLGDLITLIYLFAIARFFFSIAGLDTGSPFTAIGASREAMLGVLVEPILLLGLWVAAQVAGSTHISNITDTIYHWPVARSIPLMLALCACAFATFIEMGKLPFDLAEAEQELQEGPLTEYSGSGFAVLKWGISLKQLVVLQMFVGVFLPWGQMETFSAGGLLAGAGHCHRQADRWRTGDCPVRKQHGAPAFLRHFTRDLGRFWVCVFSIRLLAGGVI